MAFQICRLFFLILLIVISVWRIKKSTIIRKKRGFAFAIAICIIIASLSSMFPVENLIIHFKTPESAFNYMYGYKYREKLIGNESCLIIYDKNENTHGFCILPKTDQGYFLPTVVTEKKIYHGLDENGTVEVHHVNESEDYYIVAFVPMEEDINEISVIDRTDNVEGKFEYVFERHLHYISIYVHTGFSPLGYRIDIGETQIFIGNERNTD